MNVVAAASLCLMVAAGMVRSASGLANPRPDQKSAGATLSGSEVNSSKVNSSKPPKPVGPILLTLTADKSVYGVGETISVSLTAANKTSTPIPLTFISTKKYDLAIYRVKGTAKGAVVDKEPVWQWSHGRMFGMIVLTEALEVDKPFTFAQRIEPSSFTAGAKLDKGKYRLVGFLTPSDPKFTQAALNASIDFSVTQ